MRPPTERLLRRRDCLALTERGEVTAVPGIREIEAGRIRNHGVNYATQLFGHLIDFIERLDEVARPPLYVGHLKLCLSDDATKHYSVLASCKGRMGNDFPFVIDRPNFIERVLE